MVTKFADGPAQGWLKGLQLEREILRLWAKLRTQPGKLKCSLGLG